MKILIVDDDPFILDMYTLKFQEAGFTVYALSDSKGVVDQIKEEKPDVMLLDIVLPSVDGFAILEQLKKEKLLDTTAVILLSNLGEKKDIDRGFALGARDYIIKAQFTPSEVVEKVRNIIKK